MLINDRVYGQWEIDDPLAIEIINLPAFKRLYSVGQNGSYWLAFPDANTNRAEHSLGVYYLLRHFGASREEQIAGLLHDISHTVFSHVIDRLYGDSVEQTTQDKAHAGILAQSDIRQTLEQAGFDYQKIASLEDYQLLEKELPDLCADRVDYFLRDSLCFKEITPDEAQGILSRLAAVDGQIVVTEPDAARFMLKLSLLMTRKYWAPAWGCFMFERTAAAISKGLALNIIKDKDLFTTDREIWGKIKKSSDSEIQQAVFDVENIRQLKLCLDENDYDCHLVGKFRVVDPFVIDGSRLRRATEIFPELKELLDEERERLGRGYYIKVIR